VPRRSRSARCDRPRQAPAERARNVRFRPGLQCAVPLRGRLAEPTAEAHRAHVVAELAASGLLATNTDWGVLGQSGKVKRHPTQEAAEQDAEFRTGTLGRRTVESAFETLSSREHPADLTPHAALSSAWAAAANTSNLDLLTERQRSRFERIITEVVVVHGVERFDASELSFRFFEEVRPGRGRDIAYLFANSDHVVSGYLDTYGNGPMCVGDVTWVHNDADDDCLCGRGGCVVNDDDQD
jgi:hypothetical protein